jgi:hypothetical protein
VTCHRFLFLDANLKEAKRHQSTEETPPSRLTLLSILGPGFRCTWPFAPRTSAFSRSEKPRTCRPSSVKMVNGDATRRTGSPQPLAAYARQNARAARRPNRSPAGPIRVGQHTPARVSDAGAGFTSSPNAELRKGVLQIPRGNRNHLTGHLHYNCQPAQCQAFRALCARVAIAPADAACDGTSPPQRFVRTGKRGTTATIRCDSRIRPPPRSASVCLHADATERIRRHRIPQFVLCLFRMTQIRPRRPSYFRWPLVSMIFGLPGPTSFRTAK